MASGSRAKRNKQIRQLCPGGDMVLDNLNAWKKIRERKEDVGSEEEYQLAVLAEEMFEQLRTRMADHVKEHFPRPRR